MKSLKFLFMAAATFIGISSAYSENSRATYTYVNIGADRYTLLTDIYNSARCITVDTTHPCAYNISQTTFGSWATKHMLTTAGAVPKGYDRIYVFF
ncbi:hypothetical protein ACDQ55_15775 [Chitinophaga sp. 30R24]|uniref:hypothetical protein n=1 Tax=Chitinophaga sp. 30R24 TaxID=3248838 RepID=UPI003B902250